MSRCSAAAAADDVQAAIAQQRAHGLGQPFRSAGVSACGVGQSGVGMEADIGVGKFAQTLYPRRRRFDSEATVKAIADGAAVACSFNKLLKSMA